MIALRESLCAVLIFHFILSAAIVTVNAAPGIVSSVAVKNVGLTSLLVTWAASDSASPPLIYNIQARWTQFPPSVSSGMTYYQVTAPVDSYLISGLDQGSEYVVGVSACDNSGCSAYASPAFPITTLSTTPSAVATAFGVDTVAAGFIIALIICGSIALISVTAICFSFCFKKKVL